MKNTITRIDALNFAIDCIQSAPAYSESLGDGEIVKVLEKIRDQIAKPRKTSDTAKANAKAKRANARAELMKDILPTLRDALTMYPDGLTAKALYETCAETLPEDFTTAKVQYILLHELADEVVKTEAKNKPNVYSLR